MTLTTAALGAGAAGAQTVPIVDTEDATLGAQDVLSSGWLHPLLAIDLRNGDFARGNYDDDPADLDRLPAHVQIGLAADLHRGPDGEPDTWLLVRSSNGFHTPSAQEQASPRSWYESNNLVALVATPARGLRTAAIYTIKTSPNGISATTHEASISLSYDADTGIGSLAPKLAASMRPKGDGGVYVQAGIEPELALGGGEDATAISIPSSLGLGWAGFYDAGSGDRLFGSVGVALTKPFSIAGQQWNARAEILGLIRDRRLAALSGPDGETSRVVPLATIAPALPIEAARRGRLPPRPSRPAHRSAYLAS